MTSEKKASGARMLIWLAALLILSAAVMIVILGFLVARPENRLAVSTALLVPLLGGLFFFLNGRKKKAQRPLG